MAQPITARFGKFLVLLGEPGGVDPPSYPITSISKANPAKVTITTGISSFRNGQIITVAGITDPDYLVCNGEQEIDDVTTGPPQTFILKNVDTSGAAAGLAAPVGATADPPAPYLWSAPCGFTSKSFVLTKNLTEINIPDCDRPDEVAWIGRDAQNLSAAITGEGVAAAESVPTWNDAWQNEEAVPGRVEIEFSSGTLWYTGFFHVDTLTFGAEQGGRVTLNVSMQSDGQVVDQWNAAP